MKKKINELKYNRKRYCLKEMKQNKMKIDI